nr:hypoxanthine phosphoribosyltransferase [uncultured Mycoplasmataceae bacterium]
MYPMKNIDKRVERILFTNDQILTGIKKAASWIDKNYKGKKPLLVGILKGVVPFFGHLVVNIKIDMTIDFMAYSSYHGNVVATTEPTIVMDLKNDIKGKDVIVVEDIVDSGRTLSTIVKMLKKRNPKSLKVLTLADKKDARRVKFDPDYTIFQVPSKYIVGFGFDYDEQMRNLPYIGILKEEIYNKNIHKIKRSKNAK